MRQAIIFLIEIYQKFFSYLLKNMLGVNYFCKFRPTCSQYAKEAIYKDGILLGGYKALVRLMKCQPFYKAQTI